MSYFWGSRFSDKLSDDTLDYTVTEDIKLDAKIIPYDILGTQAHDLMLYKIGLLNKNEIKEIIVALEKLKKEYFTGNFKLKKDFEDVHLNIEKVITEEIGKEIGGKIHLARSRNDQILVDIRLFMRDSVIELMNKIISILENLIHLAENNLETIMPGYTHLQHAQPITFSHWCLSHLDALMRNFQRLEEVYKRINMNPLGAGAIAGSKWPIDREITKNLLGFDEIQENTLDAISSRGEIEAELISILTIVMIQISKISEDLILWSTYEFNFIELDDKFTTGSSIMPQKKNPDILELQRGKTGKIIGNLCSVFNIIKNLPSGYNRDFQELKYPLFDSIDITNRTISIFSKILPGIRVNKQKMEDIIKINFSNAVDLTDLLVEKGIPFRSAYQIVGELVKELKKKEKTLDDLDQKKLIEMIFNKTNLKIQVDNEEIKKAVDPKISITKKSHIGGPSPIENKRMIKDRKIKINTFKSKIIEIHNNLKKKKDSFEKEIIDIVMLP